MDPDIQNTGQEIKRQFYEAKRQQLGKPYSPAPRYNDPDTWYAAGEKCVELSADPFTFVKAAFLYNTVPGGPFPSTLTGNAVVRWYNQYRQAQNANGKNATEVMDQEVKNILTHALSVAMGQVRERPTDFLCNEYSIRLEIVPAFARVLLYPNHQGIREKWERLACEELNSNPRLLASVKRLGYDVSFLDNYV